MVRESVLLIALMALLCVLLWSGFCAGASPYGDLDAWLKQAGLGPYAPEKEDWDAVYEAAKKEPPLLVYMSTSRVNLFVDSFKKQFPGVQVEELFIEQTDLIPRMHREWDAGLWNVGVLNLSGLPAIHEMPKDSFVSYVPPEYRDLYPEEYQDPVFVTAVSLRGFVYNPDLSPDGPPFKSIWDLTTEEFRGKVIFTDPLRNADAATTLTTIVQHADELAADYEARFGKPLELRERDAGFEWLRRFLENEPKLVDNWRDSAEAVTNAREIMIADTNFIRMADVFAGTYNFRFATGTTPVDAVSLPRWYAIGTFSKSPNAAKLFTYAMMADESGGPFFDKGFLHTRFGWEPTQEWMQGIEEITYWDTDVDYYWANSQDILDFWMLYAP